MNFLPAFSAAHFAIAGLVCAAGPFVIHLLNRRRYRVVHWAAMDFLREALQRNRKLLQIRDLILMALRTLAVLLFGFALARPFLKQSEGTFDGTQPLHAVLLMDNSLSMDYQSESAGGTLLARAKDRAREFIDKLPKGSRISVVPLCGSVHPYSPDPYDTKDAALEALAKIEVVDRSASTQRAMNEAKKACEVSSDLAKRILLFSDQQQSNWLGLSGAEAFAKLPSVQVVDVSSPTWENSWISDLRIQDGLADVETPTTFVVEVNHRGSAPRQSVQVTLHVDGVEVASKTVALDPAEGARQVTFEHVFATHQPEPGRALFVPVKATITPDNLPADDQRSLVAPVVAALPVIFIDQFGADEEDPLKNRLGETRHLRKLLVPVTNRKDRDNITQLVRIRHIQLSELNQDILADARLVVIAGIESPGEHVPLLRDYARQGGQLVIAAGAKFDAAAWNDAAWLDGDGILAAPLKRTPFGALPEEATANLQPFFIAYESMSADEYFHLPETSDDDLRDLYAEPFFFKAIEADLSEDVLKSLAAADGERLESQWKLLTEIESQRASLAEQEKTGKLPKQDRAALEDSESQLRKLYPQWLLWNSARDANSLKDLPAENVARQQAMQSLVTTLAPRSLARFNNGLPFLVERPIGAGRTLLVTSGMLSSWNTLPKTNTMFLFDRILRGMIQSTLPKRNYPPTERITLPLPSEDSQVEVRLARPAAKAGEKSGRVEMLDVSFIGSDRRGVFVTNALARGDYRVTAFGEEKQDASKSNGDDAKSNRPANTDARDTVHWDIPLAVNGDAAESELTRLTPDRFEQLALGPNVRWVGPEEEISLAGAQIRGQDTWWWLALAVLLCLLVEIAILGWPAARAA